MGLATDGAGIQFRVLNSRKGPAVRATRAQADRTLYRKAIRRIIESALHLRVVQETVVDLVINDSVIAGVVTHAGHTFKAPAVVLTTGTFLGGRLFVGQESQPGGRAGDPASGPLAKKLRALPFRVDRLKTMSCAQTVFQRAYPSTCKSRHSKPSRGLNEHALHTRDMPSSMTFLIRVT